MTSSALLPDGFSTLEPFVDDWVLPDSRARPEKRLSCDISELRHYYDAVLPLAPDALEHLSAHPLGNLPQAEERLLKLLLSLAEVGPAVEWYEQPEVVDGFPAHRFPLVQQLSDTDAQETR